MARDDDGLLDYPPPRDFELESLGTSFNEKDWYLSGKTRWLLSLMNN